MSIHLNQGVILTKGNLSSQLELKCEMLKYLSQLSCMRVIGIFYVLCHIPISILLVCTLLCSSHNEFFLSSAH